MRMFDLSQRDRGTAAPDLLSTIAGGAKLGSTAVVLPKTVPRHIGAPWP